MGSMILKKVLFFESWKINMFSKLYLYIVFWNMNMLCKLKDFDLLFYYTINYYSTNGVTLIVTTFVSLKTIYVIWILSLFINIYVILCHFVFINVCKFLFIIFHVLSSIPTLWVETFKPILNIT